MVAVLFHTEDIPIAYRVISNEDRYKEGITFFRIKDAE